MPANLPAEAKAKWLKVMEAKTPEEKIRAMEEFLSAVPKHKGTEKLIKFVRRRMAELRREVEERKAKERGARGSGGHYVKKDGDIQLVVVGPPNGGKSSLLRCLTSVRLEPDAIPFSTVEPVPAMFVEDNVYIQLVKAPSLVLDDFSSDLNSITFALARNADGLILLLRGDANPGATLSAMVKLFDEAGISVYRPKTLVRVERRSMGGVQVVGKLRNTTLDDVKRLLSDYGIHHAVVYVDGEATLDDVENAIFSEHLFKPSIALISGDGDGVERELESLGIPHMRVNLPACDIDRRRLLELILGTLRMIRVFTKQIHSDWYTPKPLVVKENTTVGDIAKMIHSSLYEQFKYAVVWRRDEFPKWPKRVGLEYRLKDNDVVEIHAR
ncbi:TGS domain-containing protein [Thermoproteus tenax]|uniref:GTP-binding protein n=1 Tax=Thermoproteus tenax (strain ATCC 35583 / DSM 2078 / JCM 9277 / NBRC 100435 / Kra 1) TaxID=768679 RepID=G4RKM2_THETK|nr:TGS domain-containing protein [Thermoproteus tenax]CCC82117.1 GTP-binding protein [Thermoproteus tenax Kra 1]